jgi:tetratricopeptide (TPR) repeat protein
LPQPLTRHSQAVEHSFGVFGREAIARFFGEWDCSQSLSLMKTDTGGLFDLGTTCALDLDNYEEARRCFERAVRLRPSDSQTLLSKGEALLRLGRHQAMPTAFEEAAKSFEEALNSTEEAIRLKPDYPHA